MPVATFAPPHDFGRKWGIAEVDGQPSIAEGDARDPNRTLAFSARHLVPFTPVGSDLRPTAPFRRCHIGAQDDPLAERDRTSQLPCLCSIKFDGEPVSRRSSFGHPRATSLVGPVFSSQVGLPSWSAQRLKDIAALNDGTSCTTPITKSVAGHRITTYN